jgi:hypothetical protein
VVAALAVTLALGACEPPFDGVRTPAAATPPSASPRPPAVAARLQTEPLLSLPAVSQSAPLEGGACAGLIIEQDGALELDGSPVFLFGVNAHYLMDEELPEATAQAILADIAALPVNTVRGWYFHSEDPDRFDRLLSAGGALGLRFVVVLEDNVFHGVDWFFSADDEKHYRPHLARSVERFRDRPEVALWELINEPNCGDGRYDDGCLKTMRDWLVMAAGMVRALDPCRPISPGLIGAGNFASEQDLYARLQAKGVIDVASVHRRTDQPWTIEAELADGDAVVFGEVYDRAYGEDCLLLAPDAAQARARRVRDDLREALDDGVAGYLLWDYAAGAVRRSGGEVKYYCSPFGYEADDPLWSALVATDLPPQVPWRTGPP